MQALRSMLAVIAAFVAATAVMMLVEWVNGRVLYPDLGKMAQGVTDREIVREIMTSAPLGSLVVVIAGWALGSFVGGVIAAWLAPRAPARHALILGLLLTLAGIANNLMIPPPAWFWLLSVVVFLPAAYIGARLAQGRNNRTVSQPATV